MAKHLFQNLSLGGFSFLVLVILCDRLLFFLRIWKHCKFYEREWFLCDKYYNVYECVLCFIDECSSIDSVCPLMRCHCFDSLCQWDVFFKGGTDVFWIQITKFQVFLSSCSLFIVRIVKVFCFVFACVCFIIWIIHKLHNESSFYTSTFRTLIRSRLADIHFLLHCRFCAFSAVFW